MPNKFKLLQNHLYFYYIADLLQFYLDVGFHFPRVHQVVIMVSFI